MYVGQWRLTVVVLVEVEDGQDLPVVGHQCLSHHLCRRHQVLQYLERRADDRSVPCVQCVCRGGIIIQWIEKG